MNVAVDMCGGTDGMSYKLWRLPRLYLLCGPGVRKMTLDKIGREIIKSLRNRISESNGQIMAAEQKIKEMKEDIDMLRKYINKLEEK